MRAFEQSNSETKKNDRLKRLNREGKEEVVFNGDRVSVLQVEKVLEMDDGDN